MGERFEEGFGGPIEEEKVPGDFEWMGYRRIQENFAREPVEPEAKPKYPLVLKREAWPSSFVPDK